MKHRIVAAIVLTFMCLTTIGCSEPESTGPSASVSEEFNSTYEGLQTKLFDGQGCTNDACHGVAAVGGLDLRADVSYSQLVNVTSTGSELKRGTRLRGRLPVPKTSRSFRA